jgi:hypothetical protein
VEDKTLMLAKVCSAAVNGIEAYPVEVEVNAGWGDTVIVIVVSVAPNLHWYRFTCAPWKRKSRQ